MKSVDDNKSKLEQPEKEHIMISYQWGNQKTVLNVSYLPCHDKLPMGHPENCLECKLSTMSG